MGSVSVEEGQTDEVFSWRDGAIFHFSVTVLVEMAKGFCSEEETFLAASYLSLLRELGSTMTKPLLSAIPVSSPLQLPKPGRVSMNLATLSKSLLKEHLQLPSTVNFYHTPH